MTITGAPIEGQGYTTWAAVKTYLAIEGTGDDALGAALVSRASAMIDQFCRRRFAQWTATRLYDVPSGVTLWLDEDLLAVTTLTNGDGATLTSSEYLLLPTNMIPRYGIRLRSGSAWVGGSTGDEQAISLTGTWGYSSSPPDDVVQAAVRLTAWIYRQRDAPFGQTARPEIGVIETPLSMPPDVVRILAPFVKARVSGV